MRSRVNIRSVLIALENTLRIEYKDDTRETINNAVRGIENKFRVKINGDTLGAAAKYATDKGSILDPFVAQVIEGLRQMSFINQITLFDDQVSMTLKDVNWLGYTREDVLFALKYLQHESLYDQRTEIIEQFTTACDKLSHSEIKRVLVIMLVLEKLGIKEGVAVLATYLYIGGSI